jgi:N-acetylneuraminic acid mutarotase
MELIAGGVIDTEVYVETNRFLASAQLLDPKTGKWKETGKMTTPREGHAAILLRDDRVLVVGGFGASVDGKFPPILNSAELYDPATGAWMDAGTMKFAREGPSVTMKHDGKVLISGGWNHGSVSNDELFDPATGLWTVVTNK